MKSEVKRKRAFILIQIISLLQTNTMHRTSTYRQKYKIK